MPADTEEINHSIRKQLEQPLRSEEDEHYRPNAWQKVEAQFTGKRGSEFFDPCQTFSDRSIKCLYRNGGDKEMCQDYFQAYRDCKKEWTLRRRQATLFKSDSGSSS